VGLCAERRSTRPGNSLGSEAVSLWTTPMRSQWCGRRAYGVQAPGTLAGRTRPRRNPSCNKDQCVKGRLPPVRSGMSSRSGEVAVREGIHVV